MLIPCKGFVMDSYGDMYESLLCKLSSPLSIFIIFLLQMVSCLTTHNHWAAPSVQRSRWSLQLEANPFWFLSFVLSGDIATTSRSARLTASSTQRPVKVTFGSPESPVSLFFWGNSLWPPIPLAFLSLSFPSLPWCWPWSQAPGWRWGVDPLATWAGKRMEEKERGSNPGAASPGLQGVVSIDGQQQEPTE